MLNPALLPLLSHIHQRHGRFVPTSVADLFSESEEFLEVPESLLRFLDRERPHLRRLLASWLRDIGRSPGRHPFVEFMAHNTRRFLKNNNQFLLLTAEQNEELAALYRKFVATHHGALSGAGDSSLAERTADALTEHRENLREFVGGLGLRPEAPGGSTTPVCSEYSPALQAGILGLDVWPIASPLLDIGCGEQGTLVRHLRSLRLDAMGLDAFAPQDDPHLLRGDWLTYPLGRGCWGTVLSHMAFSNHFLHHHLKGSAIIGDYARRYMEILASLKPGGCFIYTPGLPFIENLLPPERYRVERRPIADAHGNGIDAEMVQLLGESTFYSACVRRLG